MNITAIQILGIITIFLSIFMAIVFFQKKNKPRIHNILLSVLFACFFDSCSLLIDN